MKVLLKKNCLKLLFYLWKPKVSDARWETAGEMKGVLAGPAGPDLVSVPGHCALALKGILFIQGAQNHFLAVCIYNSHRFVDCLTAATSNRRETWVKNMALMESCANKCPRPGTMPEYYLRRECPYPGTVLKFLYGHH